MVTISNVYIVIQERDTMKLVKIGLASVGLAGLLMSERANAQVPSADAPVSHSRQLVLPDMIVHQKAPAFSQEAFDATLVGSHTNVLDTPSLETFLSRFHPNHVSLFRLYYMPDSTGKLHPTSDVDPIGMSGVYLNEEGFLLTAEHVALATRPAQLYALSFDEHTQPVMRKVGLCAYSSRADLALCNVIGERVPVHSLRIRSQPVTQDTPVFGTQLQYVSAGAQVPAFSTLQVTPKVHQKPFPVAPVKPIKDSHGVFTLDPALQNIQPYWFSWEGRVDYNSIDTSYYTWQRTAQDSALNTFVPFIGHAEQGNSGSCLFDAEGNLIGITALGHGTRNTGGMVSAETIRAFLKQYQQRTLLKIR